MAKKKRTNRTRKSHRERRRFQQRRQRWITFGILGLITLLAGTYLLWPRPEAPLVVHERLQDNPSIGPQTAPVTLTEFGDLGCSACKAWHQAGIVDQILAQYGDQVRFEWRDFPIITPQSPKAAEAGQCAYDQGKFWEYIDIVYAQPQVYAPIGSQDLRHYAEELKLDMEAFTSCLESNQHERTVDVDLQFAMSLGLRGTPSFLVNDMPVIGGRPEAIVQEIDKALAANR